MRHYFLIIILFITVNCGLAQKRTYLWFDATANFERISIKDSIEHYLKESKEKGFTDVVLDIKPISGEVLYKSNYAPFLDKWNNAIRSKEPDLVDYFINSAHKLKLRVHLSLNVFVGGHNFFDRGIVYDSKSKWQSVLYTDSGMIPITNLKHKYSAMLNPNLEEVRDYQLKIIKEIAGKYKNADGIILDRVRYDGIEADFNDYSINNFKKYIKDNNILVPDDIFKWEKDSTKQKKLVEGKYYKEWLEWRAGQIYNFVLKAKKSVKKINPNLEFQIYVGAWYPVYYEVGVNWASKKYDPLKKFSWASKSYKNTGYAELVDILLTGNYFYEVYKSEVELLNQENIKRAEAGMHQTKDYWYSVEGSSEIVNEVTMGVTKVISSIYVEQYKGDYKQFIEAAKMCMNKSNGLMIFDIVHLINYGWWKDFRFKGDNYLPIPE